MKFFFVLFFAALFSSVAFSQTVRTLLIDDFTINTPTIALAIDNTYGDAIFPVNGTAVTPGVGILGGTRDLFLQVSAGTGEFVETFGVALGEATVSCPVNQGLVARASLIYDGSTNNPDAPNSNGLTVDFSQNGGTTLHAIISSDQLCSYTFQVYTGAGLSTFTQNIPGDDTFHDYFIPFTSFTGNANFQQVGAFRVQYNVGVNVDTSLAELEIVGPPPASPLPSPSRTPAGSAVPWVWYTGPDDDNGREPCGELDPRPEYFKTEKHKPYIYIFEYEDYIVESSASMVIASFTTLIALLIAFF